MSPCSSLEEDPRDGLTLQSQKLSQAFPAGLRDLEGLKSAIGSVYSFINLVNSTCFWNMIQVKIQDSGL